MALRLYLSPTEQVGGYQGIPRTTQVFNSTLGFPFYNGNYIDIGGIWAYHIMPGASRLLPVFPLVTTKPTGAATIVSINDAQSLVTRPAGGTTYYFLHSPLALGVTRITSALTVDPDNWIPTGSTGQWAWQFRDENYDNGVDYTSKRNLIPAMAYIWRPSTATMVGVLWCTYSQNSATELGSWGDGSANYYNFSGDWSDRWVYTHAYQDFTHGTRNGGAPVWDTFKQSVACQANDVMVIEYWCFSHRADTNYGSGQKFSMSIGGGTDVTLDGTRSQNSPGYEATPTYNTFIDIPALSPVTFPTDFPTAAFTAPPNLIAVDPGAGPHLSLTFDNPVGITGPTIGAAAAGVAVTGATQVSETQIDLELAIAPTEVITGSAQACNAFAAPTGGTATDI